MCNDSFNNCCITATVVNKIALNKIFFSFCIKLFPAVPIDNIYGTLGLLKLDITQQYSDLSRIREEIDGAGSYTMFAPSNDAWKQLDAVCIKKALI